MNTMRHDTMKSILFLVPKMNGPTDNFTYNSGWTKDINHTINHNRWKVITPSVLLLSSIAKSEGFEVDIADEEFRQIDVAKKYDIICIYSVTPNAKRSYLFADQYMQSGSWVVIGGVHSFFMPTEARQHCNTLILGEAEHIFRQFLQDYKRGNPRSQYDEKPGFVKLSNSPIPLYNILNKEEQKLVPVQTARGCSHNCKFCNVKGLYGNDFRSKGYIQIIDELSEISKLPYAKKIYITDDNIFSNTKHFSELIKAFNSNYFTWYANADISFANNEKNIQTAYKSGLRQVLIGFESIDKKNLYKLDRGNFKYRYADKYKEYINKIQSNGIGVVGSFIVGQLNDTEDTFKYLEEFIYETRLYGANITMFTPYPGTELFNVMKAENRILTYDWDYYTIFQPIIKINQLSTEKLNTLYIDLLYKINSTEFLESKIQYFKKIFKELHK